MTDDDTTVCPHCGSEFQSHVVTCIDCGTPTVPASHLAGRSWEAPETDSLPSGSQGVVLRMAESAWATGLKGHLQGNGVVCAVVDDPSCCGPSKLAVVVAEQDLERARELDREYLLQLVPEATDTFGVLPGDGECPACGSHLPGSVGECPGCGLVVGEAEG